jgi:transcriptional regulator with XRE-family HTH domain
MKNNRLEERRNKISKDIDIFVKQSFDIVDRIHEILVAQGKEQKDLAILLGKSESEISKWMTGTHNFTIKTLAKIESKLGEKIIQTAKEKLEEKIDEKMHYTICYYSSKEFPIKLSSMQSSKIPLRFGTTIEKPYLQTADCLN